MPITYQIGRRDGGWAYHLDDTWSETFSSHDLALDAARDAAARQRVGGRDAVITYEGPGGHWHTETVNGEDRPETFVIDVSSQRNRRVD
ncbi:hypothetical protein D3C71_1702670 [compost metagenome]